jgi:hypothetical protein
LDGLRKALRDKADEVLGKGRSEETSIGFGLREWRVITAQDPFAVLAGGLVTASAAAGSPQEIMAEGGSGVGDRRRTSYRMLRTPPKEA